MPSKKETSVIHLEKFSPVCKEMIAAAQNLADEMRHSKTTILHLRAATEAFLLSEELLAKVTEGFHRQASPVLVKKFKELSDLDKSFLGSVTEQLSNLPKDALEANSSFLDGDFQKFLSFTESKVDPKQKVTISVFMIELIAIMSKS